MRWGHCLGWVSLTLVLISPEAGIAGVGIIHGAAPASSSQVIRKEIERWNTRRQTEKAKLSAPAQKQSQSLLQKVTGGDRKDPAPLASLLAAAFARPTAKIKGLKGDEQRVTAGVVFDLHPRRVQTGLDEVIGRLAPFIGNAETMCVASATTVLKRIPLKSGGTDRMIDLLGISHGLIEPVEQIHFRYKGQVSILEADDLGSQLFNVIIAELKARRDVSLKLTPRPRRRKVKLSLQTVDGEKIVLPAELSGGVGSPIEVKKNTTWLVSPHFSRVTLTRGTWGQELFLAIAAREGQVKIPATAYRRRMPVHSTRISRVRKLELHRYGHGRRWFGRQQFSVGADIHIQRDSRGCDLVVMVSPTYPDIRTPPMPLTDWVRVQGVAVVDSETEDVTIGYLDGPSCGGPIR